MLIMVWRAPAKVLSKATRVQLHRLTKSAQKVASEQRLLCRLVAQWRLQSLRLHLQRLSLWLLSQMSSCSS